MAVAQGYGKTVTSGSVFAYDTGDTRNSYKGEPTVNLIPNADTMASWTTYYRTVASSTFTTEFGTTGYRFVNQPSWNGIYRNFNLGSSGFYTFSAWFRYNGGSAANNGATVYISNYGGGDTLAALDKTKVGIWQRVTFTVNVTSPSNVYFYLISYGGTDNGTGNPDFSSWEVTMPQIEPLSHATPFVNGTRSVTQGLLPLVGNSTISLSNVSFDSNAQMTFDGTDDYIPTSNSALIHGTSNWTYSAILKFAGTPSEGTVFENGSWTSCLLIRFQTNGFAIYSMGSYWGFFNFVPTLGVWYSFDFIRNGNVVNFYVNGAFSQQFSFTANVQPSSNLYIGMSQHAPGQCFNGNIPVAKIYNRALSAGEVRQNYLHYKTRFNLS